MATLNINGKRVTVDDAFLSMSPEDQKATVDEIAGQIGVKGPPPQVGEPEEYTDSTDLKNQLEAKRSVQADIDRMGETRWSGLAGMRNMAMNIPVVGGFLDEATAGLKTGAGLWGDYDKELARGRAITKEYEKRYPVESTVTGLAGGLGGGAAVLKGVGMGAQTIPQMMKRGAAAGTVLGGIEGYSRGEGGAANRLENAKDVAKITGPLGAVLPPIGRAAGAGYNAIIGGAQLLSGSNQGQRVVAQALRSAFPTEQAAAQRAAELGPDAALYNLSEGTEGLASKIGSMHTRGSQQLRDVANRQVEGSGARMMADVDQAFGPAQTGYAARIANQQTRTGQRSVYDVARGQKANVTGVLDEINRAVDDFPQMGSANDALKRVSAMMRDPRTGGAIDDAGNLIGVRSEIDDMIAKAGGNGGYAMGKSTPVGAALMRVRKAINDALPNEVRQADRILADSSRVTAANEMGRTRMIGSGSKAFGLDELNAVLSTMSAAERQALLGGTRARIDQIAGDVKSNRNLGKTLGNTLATENNLGRIGALTWPGAADRIRQAASREDTIAGGASRVLNNSETARRMSGGNLISDPGSPKIGSGPAAGSIAAVLTGSPLAGVVTGGITRAVERVANRVMSGRALKIADEAADILSMTGPNRDRAIQQLYQIRQQLSANSPQAKRLESLISHVLKYQAIFSVGRESRPAGLLGAQ